MRKHVLSIILPVILLMNHTPLVFAQSKPDCSNPNNCINPFQNSGLAQPITQYSDVENIAKNVVKWLYTMFFIVAVLFFLLAAYNYMRGGTLGEEYIKKAKSQLKYGVIAVVIALIASGIAIIISTFFGGPPA